MLIPLADIYFNEIQCRRHLKYSFSTFYEYYPLFNWQIGREEGMEWERREGWNGRGGRDGMGGGGGKGERGE